MKAPRVGQSWGLGRFIALIVFTVGTASLGIWQVRRQYEVIESGYALDRNLFEYRRLLERQKRLNLLLSAYKDPSALQVFAEEELGMRNPLREDELHIPDPRAATPVSNTDDGAPGEDGALPEVPGVPELPALPEADAPGGGGP